jgi:hypothetical protein
LDLQKELYQKKDRIVKKWFDLVASSYAPDTATFLSSQKDPFANPVGSTFREALPCLYLEIISHMDREKINNQLEPIVKIRTVQSDSALSAVSFVFLLKQILRDEFKEDLEKGQDFSAFLDIESKIDKIGLMAFEIYMNCKEKLHIINLQKEKRRVATLLKKAGYLSEDTVFN